MRRRHLRSRIAGLVLLAPLSACAHAVTLRPAVPVAPCSTVITSNQGTTTTAHAWLRPDDADDQRGLDAWCRGVGPAVATRPLASPAPRRVDRLAIVSWNTNVGAGNVTGLIRALQSGTLAGVRATEHFVLLLQEARRAGPAVPREAAGIRSGSHIAPPPPTTPFDIVRVAETLQLHLYYVPSVRNGKRCDAHACEDRGSAMLSTLPLEDLQALELPLERQRRVTIAASISGANSRGEAWTLRLVDVHLENRAGARRLWIRSGAARTRQAKALVGTLPPAIPLVLGGDLNTWLGPFESARRIVRRALARSGYQTARESPRPLRGLDFVFSRLPATWRVEMAVSTNRFGSDHPPIVAVVDLRPFP